VLTKIGIKVAFRPLQTIGRYLPSLKDQMNPEEKSCLAYQVPCQDCEFIYIGQTNRDLKSRISKHQRAIKFQQAEKSALCEHFISCDHRIDWSRVEILNFEPDYLKRLFAES